MQQLQTLFILNRDAVRFCILYGLERIDPERVAEGLAAFLHEEAGPPQQQPARRCGHDHDQANALRPGQQLAQVEAKQGARGVADVLQVVLTLHQRENDLRGRRRQRGETGEGSAAAPAKQIALHPLGMGEVLAGGSRSRSCIGPAVEESAEIAGENMNYKSSFSLKRKIRLNLSGVKHAQSRSGNGELLSHSSARGANFWGPWRFG